MSGVNNAESLNSNLKVSKEKAKKKEIYNKEKSNKDDKENNFTDKINNEIIQLKKLTKEANSLIIEKLDSKGNHLS